MLSALCTRAQYISIDMRAGNTDLHSSGGALICADMCNFAEARLMPSISFKGYKEISSFGPTVSVLTWTDMVG